MAKKNDKIQKAKSLYLTGQYSQKEISAIVEISENTISKWSKGGEWESFKISLLTTRENELHRLYKMLSVLNEDIDLKAEKKIPVNSKEADAVLKITSAIRNLQTGISIAQKVEVCMGFVELVRKHDHELAIKIVDWFDEYLKQSL